MCFLALSLAAVRASRRLDWGFENPNKTAALIATLIVAMWGMSQFFRWFRGWDGQASRRQKRIEEILWWVALAGAGVLSWYLLRTGSRGGVIAVLLGMGGMMAAGWQRRPAATVPPAGAPAPCSAPQPAFRAGAWRAFRNFFNIKFAVIAVVIAALVVVGVSIPQTGRFAVERGVHDFSIGNRWLIWQNIPAMMTAAPGGWGLGNSGAAFLEWYQLPERRELYRTLVNSHGTWFVEFGWLGRMGYLWAWVLAFRLVWPRGKRGIPSAPFGVLCAFWVCAFFSSVAEEWLLWILPGAALVAALFFRWRGRDWPRWWNLLATTVAPAAGICAGLWLAGSFAEPRLQVAEGGKIVRFGSGEPPVWVAAGAGARETPRALRVALARAREPLAWGWLACDKTGDLPKQIPLVVIVGKWEPKTLRELAMRAEHLLLFSPQFPPDAVFGNAPAPPKTKVFLSEFTSNSPVAAAWRKKAECVTLPDTVDLISAWPEILISAANDFDNPVLPQENRRNKTRPQTPPKTARKRMLE